MPHTPPHPHTTLAHATYLGTPHLSKQINNTSTFIQPNFICANVDLFCILLALFLCSMRLCGYSLSHPPFLTAFFPVSAFKISLLCFRNILINKLDQLETRRFLTRNFFLGGMFVA